MLLLILWISEVWEGVEPHGVGFLSALILNVVVFYGCKGLSEDVEPIDELLLIVLFSELSHPCLEFLLRGDIGLHFEQKDWTHGHQDKECKRISIHAVVTVELLSKYEW